MSRTIRVALAATLLCLAPVAAGATPTTDNEWRLTPGGWESGSLEYVRTVPLEAGSAIDSVIHGKYLYTTTWRSFSIYDVSSALNPVLVSQTAVPGQLINEQPQTNGKILLLANDNIGRALDIYDISNKAAPVKIASYKDPLNNHMWTCVFDCSYAYGARGTILDLSDPRAPKAVGDWTKLNRPTGFHAIKEVAPGLVLTGSTPILFLDGRQDPAKPTLLAEFTPKTTKPPRPYLVIGGNPTSLPARLDWPEGATSRYLTITMETPFSGSCSDQSGQFFTYDSQNWQETGQFTLVDEYKMKTNGTPNSGGALVNAFGCSAYGMDVNEAYDRNGLVATAWFEHGTRVLRVGDDGKISEVGGFVGLAGNASRPLWRNDEVLYVMDFNRGLDIFYVGD